MEWEFNITYGVKPYKIKAVLEYHSNQIMRIRVYGSKSTMLLENNYPIIKAAQSKKGWQWKIREGRIENVSAESSRLLLNIMKQLEHYIKIDFPWHLPFV